MNKQLILRVIIALLMLSSLSGLTFIFLFTLSPPTVHAQKNQQWYQYGTGLEHKATYDVAPEQGGRNLLAATSDGLYQFSSEKDTWMPITFTADIFFFDLAIAPASETAFAASWGQWVWGRRENGAWESVSHEGLPEPYITAVTVLGSYVYAATYTQGVYRKPLLATQDANRAWEPLTEGLPDQLALLTLTSISDPRHSLWLGAQGGAGLYWYDFVARSWQSAGLLQGEHQIFDIRYDVTTGRLYAAANNEGVYIAAGPDYNHWELSDVGLPVKDGKLVSLLLDQEKTLYAAIQGVGVYRSIDQGRQWQPFDAGLENNQVVSLAHTFSENGIDHLLVTTGDGVWQYDHAVPILEMTFSQTEIGTDQLQYTISTTNTGSAPVQSMVITNPIPAGITINFSSITDKGERAVSNLGAPFIRWKLDNSPSHTVSYVVRRSAPDASLAMAAPEETELSPITAETHAMSETVTPTPTLTPTPSPTPAPTITSSPVSTSTPASTSTPTPTMTATGPIIVNKGAYASWQSEEGILHQTHTPPLYWPTADAPPHPVWLPVYLML